MERALAFLPDKEAHSKTKTDWLELLAKSIICLLRDIYLHAYVLQKTHGWLAWELGKQVVLLCRRPEVILQVG